MNVKRVNFITVNKNEHKEYKKRSKDQSIISITDDEEPSRRIDSFKLSSRML